MLLGKPTDYARNNTCIIAAYLAEVPTQNLRFNFEMLQGVNSQANRCLQEIYMNVSPSQLPQQPSGMYNNHYTCNYHTQKKKLPNLELNS